MLWLASTNGWPGEVCSDLLQTSDSALAARRMDAEMNSMSCDSCREDTLAGDCKRPARDTR